MPLFGDPLPYIKTCPFDPNFFELKKKNISHTWLLALFSRFVVHTQRGLCCASFIVSFKGTFG